MRCIMVNIFVNGQNEEVEKINILSYLKSKNIDIDDVIVEYNSKILKKINWENTFLENDDKIEVISFVGGG
ncbi:MAG: thiamine biosynthesis protein ThiS [Spirochaetes bacterium GWD1_27_9]|nr:MAG: thiamine biosynthesis protein ThiS [Spirochaetes bacterium GWB1_27_13]OHD22721.1 MAG: thiamine biosynthesis protein ThiS [Spirochaetes bacterium GWC1_27_15]OHD28820.1 MAG: thiamine biosynthesis protein ThiS [Spirochaetes bacterium GWD1_27_9]